MAGAADLASLLNLAVSWKHKLSGFVSSPQITVHDLVQQHKHTNPLLEIDTSICLLPHSAFTSVLIFMNEPCAGGGECERGEGGGLFPGQRIMAKCVLFSTQHVCVLVGIHQGRQGMFGCLQRTVPQALSQNICEWLWQMGPWTGAGGGWCRSKMRGCRGVASNVTLNGFWCD